MPQTPSDISHMSSHVSCRVCVVVVGEGATVGRVGVGVGVGAPALARELPAARRVLHLGQRLHVQHLPTHINSYNNHTLQTSAHLFVTHIFFS